MPAAGRLTALVVGGTDSGDSDRVVRLLTDTGRLACFAPGAKRSRRRFFGALEPFTTVEVEIAAARRASGGMPTLTEARPLQVRLGLRQSYESLAMASHIVELAERTAPEGEEGGALRGLAEGALDYLNRAPASPAAQAAFELRLLSVLGYAPDLGRCVACGAEPGRTWIDLVRGGVLCGTHRGPSRPVGPKTLEWAGAVLAAAAYEPEAERGAEWADRAARALLPALTDVWRSLLDRPLRALQLLTL